MTNSFQSTAFQSATSPVDTFVQPVTVQPKSGAEELAEILQIVNPALQKFIGQKIDEEAEKQFQLGQEKVIQASKPELQNLIRAIQKQDGDKAARQLIGGNRIFRAGVEKQLAVTLGSLSKSKAKTFFDKYTVEKQQEDGSVIKVPLVQYSVDSSEFQTALNEYITTQQSNVSGIRSLYINEYFSCLRILND